MATDQKPTEFSDIQILKLFDALPGQYVGKELVLNLQLDSGFSMALGNFCAPLSLPHGKTLLAQCKVPNDSRRMHVFASGDLAEVLLETTAGENLEARVRTLFGVRREIDYGPDGSVERQEMVKGLLITELLAWEATS